MKVLLLSRHEIEKHLTMAECIQLMSETLSLMANDPMSFTLPLRSKMNVPNGLLGLMPSYLKAPNKMAVFGLKAISVFPHNSGGPFESHQGAVMLFGAEHGELLALMDASAITGIRTAAVSAVATDHLARRPSEGESYVLAILGAGMQAVSHLQSMLLVRPFTEIRVWSRTASNAKQFVESLEDSVKKYLKGDAAKFVAVDKAEQAVRGADVICTTTSSSTPVLMGDWLKSGAHVNAVGACTPIARELNTEAVQRASLFVVDCRDSAMAESGDFLLAKREGAVDDSRITAELGEIIAGRKPGRSSSDEITIFESLGIAIEDIACARYLYDKLAGAQSASSSERGSAGTWVNW